MLDFNATGYAWRNRICRELKGGHDYENDKEVGLFFQKAAEWAISEGKEVDMNVDHARKFLDSRDKPGTEPVIPEHVRLYCIELGGCSELHAQQQSRRNRAAVATLPEKHRPLKIRQPTREPLRRPSVAMRG